MTSDQAGRRCLRMWAKLGRKFEDAAYKLASSGSSLDRGGAIAFGKAAEGCFWQATGEADAFDLSRGEGS